MSIVDSFDSKTEAIINPGDLASRIDGFPSVAVVTFHEKYVKIMRDYFDFEEIGSMFACVSVPVYKLHYNGADIAMYCSTLGGAAAAGLLEEMIAKGCEKFVFFGSCGVLDKDITSRTLIVPTEAYRDEGTSYHYAPQGDYISIPTASKLSKIFTELGVSHICGRAWTTDAFYRETRNNAEKRKADGCLAVDMECASIAAVAQFRNVEVYPFFYAQDSLDSEQWEKRELGALTKSTRTKFLDIALDVAVQV